MHLDRVIIKRLPGVMSCLLYRWQGLPFIQAPGEAEATAAALNLAGNVDAVASRDGDALLFGAQTVLKEAKLLVRQCGRIDSCCMLLLFPREPLRPFETLQSVADIHMHIYIWLYT